MKRYLHLLILIFVVCLPLTVYAQVFVHTEYLVEMRDGVHLATSVYLPSTGEGPWPVVLSRTPYGRGDGKASELARNGIGLVSQDVRGRGNSEGVSHPFVADGWGMLQDGYDTVSWIQAQGWCNGSIATVGSSAPGVTQILLAGTGANGITGQVIGKAPLSNYHSFFYTGGVFRKIFAGTWLRDNWSYPDSLNEVRSHPYYDEYWQLQDLSERVDNVDWPVALQTGWYDIFQQGVIDLYSAIREQGGPHARDNLFMLIGPGTHFDSGASGDVYWPSDFDWLEHWLVNKPLEQSPTGVLYYVMGDSSTEDAPGNEWREIEHWPPLAESTNWFLAGGQALQNAKPLQEQQLSYTYDPSNPVRTRGGQNLYTSVGALDQSSVENREDVLLFTTNPLSEPLEVTGRITAVLYVSTSAQDTDFTAKLTDVYPDGRSMLICDSIRRLSLRENYAQPQEVVPGETYRLEIDLGSTSYIFNTGHSIRLAVSSSNSPRFEPNPNTGNPDWTSTEKVMAEQTVYLGGEHASYLVLPVASERSGISTEERHMH